MARQQLQQQRQAAAQRLRRCRPAAQSGVSVEAPPSTPVVPRGGRGPASDSSAPLSVSKVLFSDITLPLYDPQEQRTFDLVVVGSGPSGLAVADRVAAAGFQVG